MKEKNMKYLDTLYVQVDNTSANKCYVIIIGLASLIALGICKKVVLAFLLVGHTHCDDDRIIGLVTSYIRNLDVSSFEELKKYCMDFYSHSKLNQLIFIPSATCTTAEPRF
jgi:hypothetical protein